MSKKSKSAEKTPEAENAGLLEKRAAVAKRRPRFVRPESWRFVRRPPMWRKPKGLDNKVRKSKKGWPRRVKVGYRGPILGRNLHPSGYNEILVHNLEELNRAVPGRDVVRIGRTVGARKRRIILDRSNELGLRVVNPRGLRVIESKK